MADQFNYFYNFPDKLSAFNNLVVGPYLAAQAPGLTDLWVYDLRQGGVITLPNYWCAIIAPYPAPVGPLTDQPLTDNFSSHLTDDLGQVLTVLGPTNLDMVKELQFIIDIDIAVATKGAAGVVVSNIPADLLANLQIVSPYGPYVVKGLH